MIKNILKNKDKKTIKIITGLKGPSQRGVQSTRRRNQFKLL